MNLPAKLAIASLICAGIYAFACPPESEQNAQESAGAVAARPTAPMLLYTALAADGQSAPFVVQRRQDGKQVPLAIALSGGTARAMPLPGSQNGVMTNRTDAPWIGVRLTAVPDALAAHIGNQGLLIVNVVKGSPAEQIGLKQYDVIVSYDGQDVTGLQDLVDAISSVGTSRAAELSVIRGSQQQDLSVTAAKRPDDGQFEWVYEEPKDPVVEHLGGALKLMKPGPDGDWIFQDLDELPDALKELHNLDLKSWNTFIPNPLIDNNTPGLNDVMIWRGWQDAPGGHDFGDFELRLNLTQDGEQIAIHRDKDGRITVNRTDKDGTESTKTYETAEELEESDPDTYRIFSMHSPGARMRMFHLGPQMQNLPQKHRQFELEIQQRLDAARDQLDRTQDQMRVLRQRLQTRDTDSDKSSDLSVNIQDGGAITVRVNEDGAEMIYTFESREDFKAEQPELYERVKTLFED